MWGRMSLSVCDDLMTRRWVTSVVHIQVIWSYSTSIAVTCNDILQYVDCFMSSWRSMRNWWYCSIHSYLNTKLRWEVKYVVNSDTHWTGGLHGHRHAASPEYETTTIQPKPYNFYGLSRRWKCCVVSGTVYEREHMDVSGYLLYRKFRERKKRL
jgi:hypothetical protein